MSKKKREAAAHLKNVRHTLVLSDTDNDLHSVKYALWLTGLCNRQGRWRKWVRRFCVVHTGDWLNKSNPDPEVVIFFHALKRSAPKSCEVVLLVGNHEVEILQRAAAGIRTRLTRDHLAFIRQQDVLHVSGNILYIHGYPTLHLLALLVQVKKEGAGLNVFNQRFRKAFHEGRYALFKGREGLEMIGDIRHVKQYYARVGVERETHGVHVGHLLKRLGVDTVIHGHRPNLSIQLDYEFQVEIPGIRMINNDNKAKMTGLGAIVVDRRRYVRFINPKSMCHWGGETDFRKRVRMILGTGKKVTSAVRAHALSAHKEDACSVGPLERANTFEEPC